MKTTLGEIAKLTGAELEGDPAFAVTGAAGLEEASETDISFLENPKYSSLVASSKAGAVFLPPQAKGTAGGPRNRFYSEQPKWCYAQVLMLIERERARPEAPAISPKAEVHYEARLGKDVTVAPFAVVSARTLVGDGTRIGAGSFLGYNVRVGKDCLIYPNVSVGDYCEVGDRVILHSGTVLGSDGYGFWTDPKTGKHHKIPQIGRVVIEDDVEIGSNVSIDRATTGETRVGAGTKIDNLVQLGHNVVLGKNCLVVSQVGIAGSTEAGDQVIFAGQVGVAGHLKIGSGAVVMAQSGVMSDVEPKSMLFGSPARPHREAMKLQALFSKLPDLFDTVKELKRHLNEVKS